MSGSYKWHEKLQSYVDSYNNRVHRTISMKPKDVTKEHEKFLLENVYRVDNKIVTKTKFKLGDFVRVSKYKKIFEKSYTPNYSTEIFKIIKIHTKFPELYYLTDYLGEKIHGGFYRQELTKVNDSNGYLVEKILKRKRGKAYVKFLGFNSSHNDWVDADSII